VPVLAAALIVASSGIASAQTWKHDDAVRDVQSGSFDAEQGTYSPDRKAGDITRTTVNHTRTTVTVRVAMRAVPTGDSIVYATLRTPRTSYDVTRIRLGGLGTRVALTRTSGHGEDIRCRGLSARVRGKVVEMTVPRRCIGKPSSVRVGVGALVLQVEGTIHVDDALRRGVGDDLRLSPRIRRG